MAAAAILLRASDGAAFSVARATAYLSETIKNILGDMDDGGGGGDAPMTEPLEIPNVDGPTLRLVLKFCKHHGGGGGGSALWDAAFVEPIATNMLLAMLRAARFLDVAPLTRLLEGAAADRLRPMSVAEMRAAFGLPDDLSAADKAAIADEHAWCEAPPRAAIE